MKSDGRIVLYGLTGSGKSCLAAAAIREKYLLKKYFNNKVFWINLGDIKNDEQILRHMHRFDAICFIKFVIIFNYLYYRLYHRLKNEMTDGKNITYLPGSVEVMKDSLKSLLFKEKSSPLRNALLILDNVGSHNLVSAFDIGLKAIITTQNKEFVNCEANTTYIPVS